MNEMQAALEEQSKHFHILGKKVKRDWKDQIALLYFESHSEEEQEKAKKILECSQLKRRKGSQISGVLSVDLIPPHFIQIEDIVLRKLCFFQANLEYETLKLFRKSEKKNSQGASTDGNSIKLQEKLPEEETKKKKKLDDDKEPCNDPISSLLKIYCEISESYAPKTMQLPLPKDFFSFKVVYTNIRLYRLHSLQKKNGEDCSLNLEIIIKSQKNKFHMIIFKFFIEK